MYTFEYTKEYTKIVYIVNTKVLYTVYTKVYNMVNKATVKLYEYKSRHSINFPSEFVKDSAFPFKVKEELLAKIEGDKIIIERKDES